MLLTLERQAGEAAATRSKGQLAVAGGLTFGAGCLALALHTGVQPNFFRDWLPAALLTGAGTGMAFSVIAGTGVSGLSSSVYATGAGVLTASRQLGDAVGVAMTVAITDGASLSDPTHAFHRTWLMSAGIVVIGTALAAMIGEMQGQLDRRVE